MMTTKTVFPLCALMLALNPVSGFFGPSTGGHHLFNRGVPTLPQFNGFNHNHNHHHMGWPHHNHNFHRRELQHSIEELPTAYVIKVEAPQDRFRVTLEGRSLRILFDAHQGNHFDKVFGLPEDADLHGITREAKLNFLEVVIPRFVPRPPQPVQEIEEPLPPQSKTTAPPPRASFQPPPATQEQLKRWRQERLQQRQQYQQRQNRGTHFNAEAHDSPSSSGHNFDARGAVRAPHSAGVPSRLSSNTLLARPFSCEQCPRTSAGVEVVEVADADLSNYIPDVGSMRTAGKQERLAFVDSEGYSGYVYRGEFVRY